MQKERLPSYGGQALIEGVLMRGSHTLAAAMRKPDGEIVVQKENLEGIYTSNIKRIPFLRGLIILWDALVLGTRYLTISANLQSSEEEKIEGPALTITLIISLLIGVGLFFVAPAGIAHLSEKIIHWNSWWSNLFEGVIRLILIIGYIYSVGKLPDVKRVFRYHCAEHKTINAFEAGAELTPENVDEYSCVHTRCGTSFLLTLVILSIIVFSVIGELSIIWRLLTRILLLPLLAGIAYEYIRLTSNYINNNFVKILIKPNLALQKLTTATPDLGMLEVSITAFNAIIEAENESGA